MQAEINALALSPAQAAQRAKQQGELAALVMERFTKDAAIDAALQKFRKALQERAALTAQMVELAGRLEFAATADFDAGRFAALLDSLPAELSRKSHAWVNWFLRADGYEKEFRTLSAVRAVVLAETLACPGVFRRGECVFLIERGCQAAFGRSAKPVARSRRDGNACQETAEFLPGA